MFHITQTNVFIRIDVQSGTGPDPDPKSDRCIIYYKSESRRPAGANFG